MYITVYQTLGTVYQTLGTVHRKLSIRPNGYRLALRPHL